MVKRFFICSSGAVRGTEGWSGGSPEFEPGNGGYFFLVNKFFRN
jgi:hypothetical protein